MNLHLLVEARVLSSKRFVTPREQKGMAKLRSQFPETQSSAHFVAKSIGRGFEALKTAISWQLRCRQ
jgi:hypothetical protein